MGIEGDYTVDFDLGVNSDTNERVFMQVALYEHDHGPNPFDLLFGIRRQDLDTGAVSGAFFDLQTVRLVVPKAQRQNTLGRVLESLILLVRYVDPFEITMQTFYGDLNAGAMLKYDRISSALGVLGYSLKAYWRDGTDLKDHWLFTK